MASGADDWRPHFMVAALAFSLLLVGTLCVTYWVLGDPLSAMMLAPFFFVALGLLELSRHISVPATTNLILLASVLDLIVMSLGEPHTDSALLLWFGLMPSLAILIMGWRAGAFWLVVGLSAAASLWLHRPPDAVESLGTIHAVRLVGFVVAVFAFTTLFELSRARALRQAQDATRAKGAFLATMSHEIRTPMNGVLGMTEVMLEEGPTPHQKEQLAVIQSSGQALVSLINDLLDLSKVEASKLVLDLQPFSLSEMMLELTRLHGAVAQQKGIALKYLVGAGVPEDVRGDALRLRQVLGNLLGNATKFTDRGAVTVRIDAAGGARLRFTVSDTGIGISPEGLTRLFVPFQQLDSTATRRFGGTGLGLALSGQLVKLMGGELTVTSAPGVGTSFCCTLELPAALRPRAVASQQAVFRGGRQRVLIVDDNQVNLAVASALVKKSGFEVELACDGQEALLAVQRETFALVLMDCHMPRMDGFEATARIRALEGAAGRTPIVALTASAMEEELESCRRAGMNDCLVKPLAMTRLRVVLERFGGATTPGAADRPAGA
jgi:signal transduction histidine kinase/ActR/RegA family two-component response regulator